MPRSTRARPSDDAPVTLLVLGRAMLVRGNDFAAPLLGAGKPLALLAYLHAAPGRAATREHLLDLLWGDLPPAQARHALRQITWSLRRRLGDDAILTEDGTVALGIPFDSDRADFLSQLDRGAHAIAVARYSGPFFPGFAAPGGAEFEQWVELERRRLALLFARAAEREVRRLLDASAFRDALALARRTREAIPDDETGWRLVLESLVAARDLVQAEVEAQALESWLAELGAEPGQALRALLGAIRCPAGEPGDGCAPGGAASGRTAGLVGELVGREAEFSAALAAWDAVRRGSARHVAIRATAGLGKTRLLADLAARLRSLGVPVAAVRASPGERAVPFALAGDLARALALLPGSGAVSPLTAGVLVGLHPALSARFTTQATIAASDEGHRQRMLALVELAAAVADERPCALLVDDVHWADEASRRLLGGLLERLEGVRLLVVTAGRPHHGEPMTRTTLRLTPSPLTPPQIESLLASIGAAEPSWLERIAGALHRSTAGSPLLVLETLQRALGRGLLGLEGRAWHCAGTPRLLAELTVESALRDRIGDLDAVPRALLLLLATSGLPMTEAALTDAAGLTPATARDALAELDRRGYVARSDNAGEWEPSHDEIAAAVDGGASTSERRTAHAAVARLLAGLPAEAGTLCRLARHARLAGEPPLAARALERWLRLHRAHGDRRSAEELAAELLGTGVSAAERHALLRRMPPSLRWPLRHAGTLAASLLLLAASAAVATRRAAPPPPDARLIALLPADSGAVAGVAIPLRYGDRGPIVADPTATALFRFSGSGPTDRVASLPAGAGWIFSQATGDSGVIDLFHRSPTGEVRRLTATPRDDINAAPAPDGRSIAFATARWSPRGDDDTDIAILDLDRPTVRRLTSGTDSDVLPQWSPDGTRIAFVRRSLERRPNELCWTTVDGATLRCFTTGALEVHTTVGWLDAEHLLAVAESPVRSSLVRVEVASGQTTVLDDAPVGAAVLSPDQRWLARLVQWPDDRPAWYVGPVGELHVARRVETPDSRPPIGVAWDQAGVGYGGLVRLEVRVPAGGIALDASHRFAVRGHDTNGGYVRVPPEVVRWTSSDTTVLAIDPVSGVARPRRTGLVTVRASAGGWRAAEARVVITAPSSVVVLDEDWSGDPARAWRIYGDPPPVVVSAGNGRALWIGGDGSFGNGVYTAHEWPAMAPIGVEALVRTPITRTKWQIVSLVLTDAIDDERLSMWDHRSGGIPLIGGGEGECGFGYPAGEGFTAARRIAFNIGPEQHHAPAPSGIGDGRWYRVRLQVFADGTCGVALDGHPLWRSRGPIDRTRPLRAQVFGNSVGTGILIGRVHVWKGLRTDVNWAMLERAGTAADLDRATPAVDDR
jgi:DNA-binding SARP family transcriptional activator